VRTLSPIPFAAPLALLVLTFGCSELPTDPNAVGNARLIVQASLSGTAAAALVIEVSASDIPAPLIFNLAIEDEVARGTITLPAGSDRLLTARAFDVKGVETHRGSRTLHVRGDANDAVSITLLPLQGDQPIEITVGSYSVSIMPGTATIAAGESAQLEATVRDADDDVIEDAAVQWASLDTSVATVNAKGLVAAGTPGEVKIVAVYAGAGAAALITVEET